MSNTENISNHPCAGQDSVDNILNGELTRLDQLMNDPNCDFSRVLEHALKVIQLMSRILGNMEREYVLDNEPVLFAKVKELQGTYNTWSVLALTIVSAGTKIGAGCLGVGSAIPGTQLGNTLSNSAPNALGWLSNAAWAKRLADISQGVGAGAQGLDGFSSLLNNTNEAKRVVFQVLIEEIKRKRTDRGDAARQMRDQTSATASSCRQAIQTVHTAAQQILTARG